MDSRHTNVSNLFIHKLIVILDNIIHEKEKGSFGFRKDGRPTDLVQMKVGMVMGESGQIRTRTLLFFIDSDLDSDPKSLKFSDPDSEHRRVWGP